MPSLAEFVDGDKRRDFAPPLKRCREVPPQDGAVQTCMLRFVHLDD